MNRSPFVNTLAVLLSVGVVAGACGRSGLDPTDLLGSTEGASVGGGGSGGVGGVGAAGPTSASGTSTVTGTSTASGTSTSSTGGSGGGGGCDKDGDGFDAEGLCGGIDCNDFNGSVFPGAPESCTDAADNDCNGVADCFDPACANAPVCGCQPKPGGEDCQNGVDDDCDTIVDCFDADCAGTPVCGCLPSEAGLCVNGFDDDCDGDFDCDDSSCFADPACQCQAKVEDCGNLQDEDCDLLVDCADPDCAGSFFCACQPPGTLELCQSGFDEDCDKLVDCADPDCLVSPACAMCTAEICDDGKDNNCDNKIDCADSACFFHPACAPKPEICNNGLDDDNDTLIDCDDPDCSNNPLCVVQQSNCLTAALIPGSGTYTGDTTGNVSKHKSSSCGGDAGEAIFYFVLTQPAMVHLDTIGGTFDSVLYVKAGSCQAGAEIACDDDTGGSAPNGQPWAAWLEFGFSTIPGVPPKPLLYPGTYFVFVDGYTVDPNFGANEGPFTLNVEIITNLTEQCSDQLDNDGDVYVDCADPDCDNTPPCSTCLFGSDGEPEFGVAACTDGVDNDCDGTVDCADDDCSASDYYVTECCDGDDDNGNMIIDDFNCRCASNADCSNGQICYTHSAFACGPPCDNFFGDVCPFVAQGSFCNSATQQCEF